MAKRIWIAAILFISIIFISTLGLTKTVNAQQPTRIQGPFALSSILVSSFDGDVRRLPTSRSASLGMNQDSPRPNRRDNLPKQPGLVAPLAKSSLSALSPLATSMPSPLQNFDGLDWTAGYKGGFYYSPPDPNGDVGLNHYIQTVNFAVGIYSKEGTQLASFSFDTLFNSAVPATACNNMNWGDPIALYDAISDRWIVSDFGYGSSTGPFYECIAVSKSADPVSGGWWLYAIDVGQTTTPGVYWFNDYPKLGVWSDGIYMSANMFAGRNGAFQTARVFVFNRDDLTSGASTVRNAYYDVDSSYSSLLPSNLRGALPPSSTPAFFASIDQPNLFHLWKFQVTSWAPTISTSFTGPTDLTVNNFVMPCNAATIYTCVPQLGTFQKLDALGDRLMMQLQYRNLNGVESLWVNHTVAADANVGTPTGVRWYEIRDPNGAPFVYQQSTFQPDSNYRWMASLAVDSHGNMALGYSVSSASMYPAIRYAGRCANDTLNQLTLAEATLIAGTGAQTGTDRWGDYSAMTLDPTDGVTFWYTNEYLTAGSSWRTRIGAFQLSQPISPTISMTGPYIYYFPVIARNGSFPGSICP